MPRSVAAEQFRRVSDGFLSRIDSTPPDRWSAASPCPAWTARDVVAHVINEQRRILAAVHGGQPRPLYGVGVAEMGALPELSPHVDLSAAWREIGSGLTDAIDDPACSDTELPGPGGSRPFGEVVTWIAEDVLIHTWDLARATRGDERLDPDAVRQIYEAFKPLDEILRQPWAFGPKLPPPPGADLQTEFLCFVGRRP